METVIYCDHHSLITKPFVVTNPQILIRNFSGLPRLKHLHAWQQNQSDHVRWGHEQGPWGSRAQLSGHRGAPECLRYAETPPLHSVQTKEASWDPLACSVKATPILLPVILALHMVGCTQPLVFLHQVPTATRTMIHTHFVSHSHQQDSCLSTTKFTHECEAAYAFMKENKPMHQNQHSLT